MTGQEKQRIHAHMLEKMSDSAHDREHVHRVMRMCERIAAQYPEADTDILYAAACLHDIGREAQFRDPSVDHALFGAEMAYEYLLSIGWEETRAAHVRACIRTHRYRGSEQPATIEARILFDSDKLDVLGALGVARTLLYGGKVGSPLYEPEELDDESYRCEESFLTEYKRKLRYASARLYTDYAKRIALERDRTMEAFVAALLREAKAEDA
ncbi:MAG: HD domain-containing protein [Clostridia bacterium]|nr:HD domain-containing protein [Clostridia bacterium]MBQ4085809.1 HD domain-containing protein [Clostridia bacterium]